MKPYLLFLGNDYYPSGGIRDYQGDFESVEAAVSAARAESKDEWGVWWSVVDYSTMQEVCSDETTPKA